MTIPILDKDQLHEIAKGWTRNVLIGAAGRAHARLVITKTNIELDKIAGKIQQYLSDKFTEFKKLQKPIEILKHDYDNEIYQYIEAQTTLSFMLGLKYVQRVNRKIPDLSALETHKIKLLARKYTDSFWKNLRLNKDELIIGASLFDFFQALARMITFHSVNQATIAFGAQISAGLTPGTTANEPVYEFVTMRDDRVDCRICAPLDGMLMSPSDPEFAQPPLHYNCRCRLLLHVDGNTVSG